MVKWFESPDDPTIEELKDPLFEVIWQVIKGWDIERYPGALYAHGTGTDVVAILRPLKAAIDEQSLLREQ